MVEYLTCVFADDMTKHYHIIDSETTSNQRKQQRTGHILKGCMSFHMISVNPDGVFTTKQVLDISDSTLTSLDFSGDVIEEQVEEVVEELFAENEEILDHQGNDQLAPMLYEVIEPDTYVGLRSPPSSLELFFVVKVLNKSIANEYIEDECGHGILPKEPYLTVLYLDYRSQTQHNVKFAMPKGNNSTPVFIHLSEVFATNIEISDGLSMKMEEYRALCQELY